MANYGDVALGLGPDWDRSNYHDQQYVLSTVGHDHGRADAYLDKEPDKQHQFAWVDPRYRDEVAVNRTKGYVFVNKDDWAINELLWQWDAEGYCIRFDGQRLMARPKEIFVADMLKRKQRRSEVMGGNKEDEEVARRAEKLGIQVYGEEDGKPIRRGLRTRN